MGFGYDIVVTVTGVVLVFLILVLLMVTILLEGKIFDSITGKKKAKLEAARAAHVKAEAEAAAAAPVAAPAAAPVVPEEPEVEEGIPGDVIAAIAAAVYAIGNGKYTLRAVRRVGHGKGRGVWGKAGVSDTTAPF